MLGDDKKIRKQKVLTAQQEAYKKLSFDAKKEILRNPLFYIRRQVNVTRNYLFDVHNDPSEVNNLAKNLPDSVSYHKDAINKWLLECNKLIEAYAESTKIVDIDDVTLLEHLRSLGYVE